MEKLVPKLQINCYDHSTFVAINGQDLGGITHIKLDVPSADKGPTLTLELDVRELELKELPKFMK